MYEMGTAKINLVTLFYETTRYLIRTLFLYFILSLIYFNVLFIIYVDYYAIKVKRKKRKMRNVPYDFIDVVRRFQFTIFIIKN